METRYKKVAYVDCEMKRKWETLEEKWQSCTEYQTISYMKRYCKSKRYGQNTDDEYVEFLTGEILFEDEKYAIEYNDYIFENVILYEKQTN